MISKFKPFQGPLQFVFKDPDTGMEYGPEVSKKALLDRVRFFREQNKLPEIEFLDDVLENYWCCLPENIGRCEPKVMPLGVLATLKGGVAVLKNYMYKSFASQEIAEQRASQCAGCKYNKLPDTEGLKYWLDLIALNSVAARRTKEYDRLGTCGVCECPLNMKVFYNEKIPKPTAEQKKKYDEVSCWQLNIIED